MSLSLVYLLPAKSDGVVINTEFAFICWRVNPKTWLGDERGEGGHPPRVLAGRGRGDQDHLRHCSHQVAPGQTLEQNKFF